MNENQEECPSSLTKEDIDFLLKHQEITPDLQDLITQYQRATLEDPIVEEEHHTPAKVELQTEEHKIGSKCAIIIPYDKYQLVLLPAVILGDILLDQVQVLILTPVTINMVACPAYLNNDPCSKCSYSHGHTVPINQVLPFEALEMNSIYHNLNYETKVWCKRRPDDVLWKLGCITDQLSSTRWRVKLKSTGTEIGVDIENLTLFKCLDDDNESSESGSESEPEHNSRNNIKQKEESWGGWEAHTTGFASKMMKKMGYVDGRGLGINAEGRADPIHVKSINQNVKSGLGFTETKRSRNANKGACSFVYGYTVKATDETTKLQSELDKTISNVNSIYPPN
ncbi:hypothetical protein HPULCUR_001179 [Helicostylum pulchrum]|uniref:G-patch domain-containing protein n=1 Tax=Helicostylum pulchrum TaxID=562976 RepID=A0ABP9XP24_9FUNG